MQSIEGSPRLATVGMFYVRPEFRQTGLGSHLFKKLLQGEDENNLGLNGVMAMTAKYADRHGFDKYATWKESINIAKTTDINTTNLEVSDSVKITDRSSLNWDEYMKFDVKILAGVRRDGYIKNYLSQTGAHNRFALDSEGHVVGVCNIREVLGGNLIIGPFYAENHNIATSLLKATVEAVPNFTEHPELHLVSPDTNASSLKLFKTLSGGKSHHWGYMISQFTKKAPAVPSEKIYSISDYANNFV